MPTFSKEEIAAVLHVAEILKQKGSDEKINISQFCREAGISRKNAYKHKKNIYPDASLLEEKVRRIEQEKAEIESKLAHAEKRAHEADLYWELRNILVALNRDVKKNGPVRTRKQLQLTDEYNRITALLGLEPYNFWD
jgi:hypothetical protein